MSSDLSDEDGSSRSNRRKEKTIELIEVDGKRVSKTSTGKRKFHKKSKNGCDNCKRRRVKCDEAKPACQKCLAMKLDCIYTPVTTRKRKNSGSLLNARSVASRREDLSERLDSSDGENDDLLQAKEPSSVNGSRKPSNAAGDPRRHSQLPTPVAGQLGSPDNLLLPPLFPGENMQLQQQIQQQPQLLPQLMTLSNSEKFAGFDFPNSPPFQSTSMNLTNSIGSIFAANKLPTNVLNNVMNQQQQQQQRLSSPHKSHHHSQQHQHPQASPLSSILQSQEMVQTLSKAGVSFKQMAMFSTAGIGGVTYDFQELLGMKANGAGDGQGKSATATAEEVLAKMQHQHQQSINRPGSQNMPEDQNGNTHRASTSNLDPNGTPSLANNPTISPAAPMSPMAKAVNPHIAPDGDSEYYDEKPTSAQNPVLTSKMMDKSNTQESTSTEDSQPGTMARLIQLSNQGTLNLVDLKLFHHYCTETWPTITSAGISGERIWSDEIPKLAFDYPFLMHALLAFSATHLSRKEPGLEQHVAAHRLDALRLLRKAVLEISEDNTDALVASALILIMDSLANASSTSSSASDSLVSSMSPSAWIFHVKGAATILTAVWPLTEKSRFHNLISVDLSDLGDIINQDSGTVSELVCFDESISDLYPVEIDSPYLITLAYLDKLHHEKNQSDFILRVFAFPALLDKTFLALLMTGDMGAMRIMRCYYQLLRGFATEVKDKVWFLEGVTQVLPQDVDDYSGGGMHMMLDFLGGGLPSMTTTNLQPGLSDFM
ncbi:LANO_0G07294g1_1 [Lachancea nothofagi CBS 11611]|uniref:LANO_0G07294g1_1 n=1 Tax=Lachancea nothofagi CBS 11611 TaxID=1266666 RepID=A0A1G4KHJ0_9SACH|nr:LANO_0G07294g1_1 [Lachancea nothofagi CBS 11611]